MKLNLLGYCTDRIAEYVRSHPPIGLQTADAIQHYEIPLNNLFPPNASTRYINHIDVIKCINTAFKQAGFCQMDSPESDSRNVADISLRTKEFADMYYLKVNNIPSLLKKMPEIVEFAREAGINMDLGLDREWGR